MRGHYAILSMPGVIQPGGVAHRPAAANAVSHGRRDRGA